MTKAKEKNYVAIAARYAGDVVSGKILACQWTIKACQRQIYIRQISTVIPVQKATSLGGSRAAGKARRR